MDLAEAIYLETNRGPLSKDYGLKDQIRRSAVSVASNIAEGDELDTLKQGLKYFYYSRGSLAELETQLLLGARVGYDTFETYDKLIIDCHEIGAMINGLIKFRSKRL